MRLRKIKALTMALLAFVVVGVVGVQTLGLPAYAASTNLKGDACAGLDTFEGNSTPTACNPNSNAGSGVNNLITTIVNVLSWVVGIVAVIMIIVAGLRYVTSGGASEKIADAKKTLMYALIGIVVVVLAQFLVAFTVNSAKTCTQTAGTPTTASGCPAK